MKTLALFVFLLLTTLALTTAQFEEFKGDDGFESSKDNQDEPVAVPENADEPVAVPENADEPVAVPENADEPEPDQKENFQDPQPEAALKYNRNFEEEEEDGDDEANLEQRAWTYICDDNECVDICKRLKKGTKAVCGPDQKCYCHRIKKARARQ